MEADSLGRVSVLFVERMPTGAELFVDALETLGVRQIFTLVGDHLNVLSQAIGARSAVYDRRADETSLDEYEKVGI